MNHGVCCCFSSFVFFVCLLVREGDGREGKEGKRGRGEERSASGNRNTRKPHTHTYKNKKKQSNKQAKTNRGKS